MKLILPTSLCLICLASAALFASDSLDEDAPAAAGVASLDADTEFENSDETASDDDDDRPRGIIRSNALDNAGEARLADIAEEEAGAPIPKAEPDLAARLAEVEKELKAMKKKEAEKKPAKADEKKPDDIWTDMSTDKWTIKTGGHVQADYITWAHADDSIKENAAPPGPANYFEFRRLRLTADGTGYGVYDFRLQMTLEPEAVSDAANAQLQPVVKDAYFSINEVPWFGRLRIGNFFVPSSLEQVTNDTNNIFLERSIPTQGVFAVDREVGVAQYNCSANQRFTWTSGIFIDSISEAAKLRIDNNQGYRLVGRVTYLPYYDEPSNGRYLVHTGASILYTHDQDELVRIRARPQIHLGPRLIDTGNLNASNYTTGGIEGAVVWANFTVQSEAFLSQVNMNATEAVNLSGAYVHASYFLTGENRIFERFGQHGPQFGRNVPFSNVFFLKGGSGLGGLELKARWSNLNLNGADSGVYNDVTVGLNWYWSDRTRMMFDYIHPVTSSTAIFGKTQSDILGMRFDFNW